jgi:hypothetical protein
MVYPLCYEVRYVQAAPTKIAAIVTIACNEAVASFNASSLSFMVVPKSRSSPSIYFRSSGGGPCFLFFPLSFFVFAFFVFPLLPLSDFLSSGGGPCCHPEPATENIRKNAYRNGRKGRNGVESGSSGTKEIARSAKIAKHCQD